MTGFYKKVEHPDPGRHSKCLKVLKYLDESGSEKSIDFDLFAAQNYNISKSFKKLFSFLSSQEKSVTIVEIGTFKGGLTVILDTYARAYNLNYDLYTYDVTDRLISDETKQVFNDLKIKLTLKDVFSDNGDEVRKLISDKDRLTVLLCDGGQKAKEIIEFSRSLKVGDNVIRHDYGFNGESFFKKEWNPHELSFADISKAYN